MKNQKKPLPVMFTLLALATLVALFLGGGAYIEHMRSSLWIQSISDVLEITAQGTHAFEVYLDQGFAMLEGRAGNFAQYSSSDVESIGAKLDMYEDGAPTFTAIDITHRIIYFNSSSMTVLPEDVAEEYSNLPDHGVLDPYLNEYTGQRMFGFYERFTFADGAEGMVRKGTLLSEVGKEFSLSFFNDTGFSYVVNNQGDIILRPASPNSNRTFLNVYDVIEVAGSGETVTDTFRAALAEGSQGAMRITSNGEECVFSFVPVKNTDGWYVVSIIPSSSITTRTEQLIQSSRAFVFMLGIALSVFLLFGVTSWQYRRSVQAKDAEIKYREQLFGILASSTNEVFLMLESSDLEIEYVSPNVERVLGVPRQQVMESTPQEALSSLSGWGLDTDALRSVPLGNSAVYEGQFTHAKTGEKHWVEENVYHSAAEGSERYIVVVSDRTEDRQKKYALTEALNIAKAANQSKSAFLANMSHDIRTPMNAIVGLATLLQRDAEDPEKVREHTRKITASSQHLLGLINNVLDMSKIESGRTTLSIGEIDLAEVVEELETILRPQARAKRQTFEIYVRDLKDEQVLGDRLRISQILINILSNAVKYTPAEGRIEMTVQELAGSTPGFAHLQFRVKDTGVGMSPEFLDHIFLPFSREEGALTSGVQGTGLGMAITKNLVDLMGGAITVESEPGKGSIFTVDLELQIQSLELDRDFWKENGITRTLVVDDDADACSGVLAAMAETGVVAESASGGYAAIELVKAASLSGHPYDVILLDWIMPGMDGLETARRIREIVERNVPIMILTSYDYSEVEDDARKAGIDGFLPKPFFLGSFKHLIRGLHSGRELDSAPAKSCSLKGRNILAAEDNLINGEILSELLAMRGAACHVEEDGQRALERFRDSAPGEYDAIFLDIQMPVMNGYEAARAIRACGHPQAKTIPIIAMTANAFADDVTEALNAGMDAHVAKPVDMDRLEAVLGEIFDRRSGESPPEAGES